ncbi:hypothetical protein L195_g049419, partial [Trifolium pratense]
MSNSDNIVDDIVQPFVVVNDHVAPSDKSISDSVVELVTFSIKEKTTTVDVAQDDKENNYIPADVIEDSKTEESKDCSCEIETMFFLCPCHIVQTRGNVYFVSVDHVFDVMEHLICVVVLMFALHELRG